MISVRTVSLVLLLLPASLVGQGDVSDWIQQLHRERDDAELELVEKIGRKRTRIAAEGLTEAYDKCVTLLFRREITKTLAWFANLPASQQPALDKLAEIAGGSEDPELRALAMRGLAQSATIGKQLLRRIIDSKAADELRLLAMREYVRLTKAGDSDWLRKVWNLENKQRKDESGEIMPPEHNEVRQLAFGALLPFLKESELVAMLKRESDPKIRRAALEWMDRRKMAKAVDMASWVLDRVTFRGPERSLAARIVAEAKGEKAISQFVKLAKKRDVTQSDLRLEMARLISNFDGAKARKRAAKLIGKGKPHERVFGLQATAKNNDEKLLQKIRKELKAKDADVRRAAGQALGLRRDRKSMPALRDMLTKSKEVADIRIALEAINQIQGPMTAWLREMAEYAAHEDRDIRNAALSVLAEAGDKRQLKTLMAALEHEDWSSRLIAIDALGDLRQAVSVGKLVERMGVEQGRLKKRLAEALWAMTAQPFDEDEDQWSEWWKTAKQDFEVVSEKELEKASKKRELRRLTQRTVSKAKFFGIKVESHRVIFVLDVSGSMLESMYGRQVQGRVAARIDVAKEELSKAVKNLEPAALFNIYTFSSGVALWQEEGVGTNSGQSREDALTFIDRLGASGGTNLYDSIRAAFADKDVDTIFVLSDGEPTTGDVIDPFQIRQDVALWNKHRKVKINTIAIGGNLEVLEWLAEDAGGTYRQMR